MSLKAWSFLDFNPKKVVRGRFLLPVVWNVEVMAGAVLAKAKGNRWLFLSSIQADTGRIRTRWIGMAQEVSPVKPANRAGFPPGTLDALRWYTCKYRRICRDRAFRPGHGIFEVETHVRTE